MRGWGSVRALYLEIRVRARSVCVRVCARAYACDRERGGTGRGREGGREAGREEGRGEGRERGGEQSSVCLNVAMCCSKEAAECSRSLSPFPPIRHRLPLPLPLSSSLSLSLRRSYRLARGDAGGQTNASAGLATAEAGADGAGGDDAERPWKKLCFWMWRQVCMLPGRPADSTTPQSLFPEPQTLRFACCLSFFNCNILR